MVTTILPFPGRPAAAHVPADLTTLREDWLAHLRARGAADNTLAAYRRDLDTLIAHAALQDVSLVQLVSERMLSRWLDGGILHLGWGRRTACRRATAVRNFLAWCRAEGYIAHDPATTLRIKFRPRRVVAPELDPLRGMIAAIGTRRPFDLRDRAALLLMLDGALRAGEVAALDVVGQGAAPTYFVDLRCLRVHVPPKGSAAGDVETVGLERQTCDTIAAWLRIRANVARPGERALFVNQHGKRLSRQSLYTVVRQRGAAAGLPDLHPHKLRHRRIGDVVERLGLKTGAALARHRNPATTANIYGAHADEVQRNAIRELAPLGRIV
jgi:site-specific recombinase XerC